MLALEWISCYYPEQKTIIDVEGFVSNSMVYWTNNLKYQHYVAIEPVYEEYKQLIKNIGKCVKSFVSMYNIPLGEEMSIDDMDFSDVTLMKFGDTYMTQTMIMGALKTIEYHRPIVLTQRPYPFLENYGLTLVRKGKHFIYIPKNKLHESTGGEQVNLGQAGCISG